MVLKVFVLIGFLFASFCGFAGNDTTEIIILHVNDMHAKFDNLAKIAHYKNELKKKKSNVFLVSAGDMFSGNPVVDQHTDKGFPLIEIMNAVGFDLGCFGNHEFDYGQDLLFKRIKQALFPLICANVNTKNTKIKQPEPYNIISTKDGKKIAFLGLLQINENGLPSSHPNKLKGMTFLKPITTAKNYKNLKKENDVFIALSHCGYDEDLILAKELPELDVIIGAHTHFTIQSPPDTAKVYILQAGYGLKYLGQLTIKIVGNKIISRRDTLIELSKYSFSDSLILKKINAFNNNESLREVVANTKNAISGLNNIGAMMCDALTDELKLDMSFHNNGGIRLDSIPAGNITKWQIYKLDPFGNEVMKMKLNYDEIKSLITSAYNRKTEFKLQCSGVTMEITYKGNDVQSVIIKDKKGMELDLNKIYSVGLNSFITSSYQFNHKDQGTSLYITSAEVLINFLKKKKSITYSFEKRITIKNEK